MKIVLKPLGLVYSAPDCPEKKVVFHYTRLVMRKPIIGNSVKVRQKEPRHEKTCIRGFRPDLTQTGPNGKRFEITDLESRGIVLSM